MFLNATNNVFWGPGLVLILFMVTDPTMKVLLVVQTSYVNPLINTARGDTEVWRVL